jgi:hypothetical protein
MKPTYLLLLLTIFSLAEAGMLSNLVRFMFNSKEEEKLEQGKGKSPLESYFKYF